MEQPISLAEIAKFYDVSPKTFSRDVRKKGIPHEMIGRQMRFVLSTVRQYLSVLPEEKHKPSRHFKGSKVKSKTNKFAEAVGV